MTRVASVEEEVRNLVGTYCNEVTSGDVERWIGTWLEDATWGIPGAGTIVGRPAIREQFASIRTIYVLCVQAILSMTIVVDDADHASSRTYVRELQWKRIDGELRHSELIGWYDDRIARGTDGALRFAERNFTLLTSSPLPWDGRLHRAVHELNASGSA